MVIEPLIKAHDCKRIDCTEEWMVEEKDREDADDMNHFIRHHALDQVKKGISRTFVLRDIDGEEPNRVLAYYSTSVGHLAPVDIPKVVSPRMTIPVIFLLRLAVDKNFQRRGFGAKLMIHFLVQVVQLANQTGIYALVLEPLNEHVRSFYQKFGLLPLPRDPNRMYVRIRDIEEWLKQH